MDCCIPAATSPIIGTVFLWILPSGRFWTRKWIHFLWWFISIYDGLYWSLWWFVLTSMTVYIDLCDGLYWSLRWFLLIAAWQNLESHRRQASGIPMRACLGWVNWGRKEDPPLLWVHGKKENTSVAPALMAPVFLTVASVGAMWPATSGSCHREFLIMMEYHLEPKAKINLFFLKLLLGR